LRLDSTHDPGRAVADRVNLGVRAPKPARTAQESS
jgi:hypothetical protein